MKLKRSWFWAGVAALVLGFLYLPTLGIGAGQLLAFLLVLLCPLMHFLGGHGHGQHGREDGGSPGPSEPDQPRVAESDRETPRLPQ